MTEWWGTSHELSKIYNRTLRETLRQNRLYFTNVAVENLTGTSLKFRVGELQTVKKLLDSRVLDLGVMKTSLLRNDKTYLLC